MKCPECGSENKDGAVFCKICGTSLTVKTSPDPNKSNSDSSSSSYSDMSSLLYPYTIHEIIKDKYMVINII